MWEFVDQIVFINLERRKDRLEHMNEVCKVFPPEKVQRFNAIETPGFGSIGCGRSHVAVLELAIQNNWKNVLILEDDATWNKYEEGYAKLEQLAKKDYDVILLGAILTDDSYYRPSHYDTETSRVYNAQTCTAYLVHQNMYAKLRDVFTEAIDNLEVARQHWIYAIDQYWKTLQSEHYFYMVMPCMMYQYDNYSDNTNTYVTYSTSFIV